MARVQEITGASGAILFFCVITPHTLFSLLHVLLAPCPVTLQGEPTIAQWFCRQSTM